MRQRNREKYMDPIMRYKGNLDEIWIWAAKGLCSLLILLMFNVFSRSKDE